MDEKYKDQKMSAEEVERELMIIQLHRERIALEKELAQQEMKSKFSSAMGASRSGLLAFLLNILNLFIRFAKFIRRNAIKLALIFILFFGGISGIITFHEYGKEAFLHNREEHLNATCGYISDPYSCYHAYGVEGCSKKYECRRNQDEIFTKKYKPFLFFEN